jgi:hypothetical protein
VRNKTSSYRAIYINGKYMHTHTYKIIESFPEQANKKHTWSPLTWISMGRNGNGE